MSRPEDLIGDAIERLEFDERNEEDSPHKDWRQLTRRTALTGGAAGIAALVLEACGGGSGGTTTTKAATPSAGASIWEAPRTTTS